MSESSAHEALASFLRDIATPRLPELAFCFHVANESAGGAKSRSGVPLDVLKEARMLVRAGVWDFLLIGPNQARVDGCGPYFFAGLACELKSTRAYRTKDQGLSPAQIAWRVHYIKHGWYTAVYPEEKWEDAGKLLVRWVGGNVEDFNFS